MPEVTDFFEGDKPNPYQKYSEKYGAIRINLVKLILGFLLALGVTVTLVGLLSFLKTWELILNIFGVPVSLLNLKSGGNLLKTAVESFGSLVIGYITVNLSWSVLKAEMSSVKAEEVPSIWEHLSRIVVIIIVALGVEAFSILADVEGSDAGLTWEFGAAVLGIAALLAALGYYIKSLKKSQTE
ncbi:MAG: hypothetical protein V1921_00570 [Candidatus Altiarchaeota archaeon]